MGLAEPIKDHTHKQTLSYELEMTLTGKRCSIGDCGVGPFKVEFNFLNRANTLLALPLR